MCGIVGKYFFANDRKVDLGVIEGMTDVMSHRGPDDRGILREQNVALGHRRLSILDLSPSGHQPMSNEDGTVWVIFNGEIYDYKRLRDDLQTRGHVFRSTSDTEVIVHAYEEFGIDCVKHFDGMFAFAIWDRRQQRVVLARDHFGIKPLYYYETSEFISFASEIKAILADPAVTKAVDPQALSNFLTLHYVPAPRTMFEGVRKLLPGQLMVIEQGRTRIQQYWELSRTPLDLPEEEAAECIYHQLKHSVSQRLQSDVPVGTLLSGGLDSSAVLGLMTEIARKPIPAFSVGYSDDGGDGFSEFRYSRLVAKHFSSDYHEAVVTPQMFMDFLPKAVWYQDEPIGEPASIPLYYVCKLAKDQGITVLLSGEGSDELFAGYNRHIGEMFSGYYGRLPEPLTQSAAWLFSRMPRVPVLRKGHKAMTLRDFWQRYQSWHTVFPADLKQRVLTPQIPLSDSFADTFAPYLSNHNSLDNLSKLLWLDIKVWLPDDLLMKKDRMGMATSIEARVPFLDHRFAEMVFNLSSSLKVRRLTGKYVFKKSMERVLPKEIIYRKKQGFPTPISRWLAHDLREPITDILTASNGSDHGYFDRKVVRRFVQEHVSGRENHERLLFPLLNFDVWYNAFFQQRPAYRSEIAAIPSVA